MFKIVVVGPNASYRLGLAELLACKPTVDVCAWYETVAEVLAEAPLARPSLVIVDGKARDSVLQARRSWPEARLICLLDYMVDLEMADSLGADECILKDQGADTILRSVSETLSNGRRECISNCHAGW